MRRITEKLSPEVAAKAEEITKEIIRTSRDNLFKKYGKDAEKVAYGRAVNQAKKSVEEKKLTQAEKDKKEDIIMALKKEKGSKKKLTDKDYAIATSQAKRIAEMVKSIIKTNSQLLETEDIATTSPSYDPVDLVSMDIPLFIRLLEFAREDAQEDVDLHEITQRAVELTKQQGILQMDDYDEIIAAKDEINEGAEALDANLFVASIKDEFDIETLQLMQSVIQDQINLIQGMMNAANPRKIVRGLQRENKLLKQSKLSSTEYQKAKKLKDFNPKDYTWDKKEQLYIKK